MTRMQCDVPWSWDQIPIPGGAKFHRTAVVLRRVLRLRPSPRRLVQCPALLRQLRRAAEGRADRAEQAIAGERARADAVRARLDAMQEQLAAEAEAADQARSQAQAAQDNAEKLREADATRKGRGRLARLKAAWRGE